MKLEYIKTLQRHFRAKGLSEDETNLIISMMEFADENGFWDEFILEEQEIFEGMLKS